MCTYIYMKFTDDAMPSTSVPAFLSPSIAE